ncbi:hypothetical protein [Qipengyuania nanhaisediminis]
MRESLDPWPFVLGAYGLTLITMVMLAAWAYRTMRSAEARRDETRRK